MEFKHWDNQIALIFSETLILTSEGFLFIIFIIEQNYNKLNMFLIIKCYHFF